ncbi:hypothetical protein SNEBB_004725 [Seison nebaliae]|nr:hypothetical protein SNEBB_004725 [Seison nebaliae]
MKSRRKRHQISTERNDKKKLKLFHFPEKLPDEISFQTLTLNNMNNQKNNKKNHQKEIEESNSTQNFFIKTKQSENQPNNEIDDDLMELSPPSHHHHPTETITTTTSINNSKKKEISIYRHVPFRREEETKKKMRINMSIRSDEGQNSTLKYLEKRREILSRQIRSRRL